VANVVVAPGPALTSAGKGLQCSNAQSAVSCIASGTDSNSIASGVVALITVVTTPQATGVLPIQIPDSLGATDAGDKITIQGVGGNVNLPQATPVITAFSCNPNVIQTPGSSTCAVTLDRPAASGATVMLTSTPSVAPASVAIPPGLSVANFTISSGPVAVDTTATLTASLGNSMQTTTVTLKAPSAPVYNVTATPLRANPGDNATVSWSAPANHFADDWIGLLPVGSGNYLWWTYTGPGTSGGATVPLPGTTGNFEFRYLQHNGFTQLAKSPTIVVANSGGSSVTVTASMTPTLQVSWSATSNRANTDWVGLFLVGSASSSYMWWHYTNAAPAGTFAVPVPPPGQYEFRYFYKDTFNMAARSAPFTVSPNNNLPTANGR